jgi:Fur family ferric uptake transcriptional regulator
MAKYITKQRKALLQFLQSHPDEPFSAAGLAKALPTEQISISAVYRNLCDLEKEGQVRRMAIGGSREVYYQYAAAECCKAHLHLNCKGCGKTFHMNLPDAEFLIQRVDRNEGFAIDKKDTILYGLCAQCREVGR